MWWTPLAASHIVHNVGDEVAILASTYATTELRLLRNNVGLGIYVAIADTARTQQGRPWLARHLHNNGRRGIHICNN